MPRIKKSEKVPRKLQERFDAIVALTDEVCQEHLDEEYAQLARQATAALCRKRPSPLLSGRVSSWACGIVYALGFVNFLSTVRNDFKFRIAEKSILQRNFSNHIKAYKKR